MRGKPTTQVKMQTLAEKCEAIKTLLPCLAEHLHCHPAYRLVPRAQWVSEGGEPPGVTQPPCDQHCWQCTEPCRDATWVLEYRRIRRAYPIVRKLERLLDLRICYQPGGSKWRFAIMGLYVTPWDVLEHGEWPELAERGIAWLAEQCRGEVPWYEGAVPEQGEERRDYRTRRILYLRERGLSVRRIAQRVGVAKSTVSDILHAHGVRLERKVAAGG